MQGQAHCMRRMRRSRQKVLLQQQRMRGSPSCRQMDSSSPAQKKRLDLNLPALNSNFWYSINYVTLRSSTGAPLQWIQGLYRKGGAPELDLMPARRFIRSWLFLFVTFNWCPVSILHTPNIKWSFKSPPFDQAPSLHVTFLSWHGWQDISPLIYCLVVHLGTFNWCPVSLLHTHMEATTNIKWSFKSPPFYQAPSHLMTFLSWHGWQDISSLIHCLVLINNLISSWHILMQASALLKPLLVTIISFSLSPHIFLGHDQKAHHHVDSRLSN